MLRNSFTRTLAALLGVVAPVAISIAACSTTVTPPTVPTSDTCRYVTKNGTYFCVSGTAPASGSCSGSADAGIKCTTNIRTVHVNRGCTATSIGCTYSSPNSPKIFDDPLVSACP